MVIGEVDNELNATHPMYNIPAKAVWAAGQHFCRHNYDLYSDDNTIPSNGASPDFWAEFDETQKQTSAAHRSSSDRPVDDALEMETDMSVTGEEGTATSERASSVATATDSGSDITWASGSS